MDQIPDINLLKAIVAAAGGAITLDDEIYQTYLSMDLDDMELVFDKEYGGTTMTLRYKTNEEADSV